jgi:peptidoglycan/xylan/chitin deacetylase (PgdA/CDA1 family)
MKTSIPILMYHQVSPQPLVAFRTYTVTPKAFAAQMAWLALTGYVPINMDKLLEYRSRRAPLPSRPVIITFDDGFQSIVEYAVPILQAQGFTAVFYLVAGLVGKSSRWILPELGIECPLMDWNAARQLERGGFQCGSHTMSHPRLSILDPASCSHELVKSRCLMEDSLGHEVRHLSYPFGSFNDRVRSLVAETGYRSACSTQKGLSGPDDDCLALHRIPVKGQDSLLDFICRLHTTRTVNELLHSKAQDSWQWLWRKKQTTNDYSV